MTKNIHWQTLSLFESHDFVTNWYRRAHARQPSTTKISQINACFAQAREYFSNAGSAAMSVKPLLLYYGALTLGRGIILANDHQSKEESLKQSHGLEPVGWQSALSGGIKNILQLQIRSTRGTFPDLANICWNLHTMHKFQGPTNDLGSDGHNLEHIKFATDGTLLKLDDLVSRLLRTGPMYGDITGRSPRCFRGCRIASHPPGTHYAFPLVGIPEELASLANGRDIVIGSSNQIAPGLMQNDDAADCLIFVHQTLPEYRAAQRRFPVSHYETGEYMLVFLDFPNGDRMTEFFKLYLVSYYLGMLCRYFPSAWTNLSRNAPGDFAQPLLVAALEAIEADFPMYANYQLGGYPKPREGAN